MRKNEIIATLFSAFGVTDSSRAKIYIGLAAGANLNDAQLKTGVSRCIENCRFLPSWAELMRECLDPPESELTDLVFLVKKHLHGWDRSPTPIVYTIANHIKKRWGKSLSDDDFFREVPRINRLISLGRIPVDEMPIKIEEKSTPPSKNVWEDFFQKAKATLKK